tara:strand:+ start:12022 stop:12405 length:384 start_codon:yes stop_codon:yes gene_type:complete
MPKKTKQSKSRKNRTFRKKRLTIKSAGGGFFGWPKNKSPPQTAENSTPKPETLKDLEKMFPNGIPLSVIKVDLDEAEKILKKEEDMFKQYEALPDDIITRRAEMQKAEMEKEVTSNVPSQPETEKLF